VEPASDDDIVHQLALINTPNSIQGSPENSHYLGLAVETQTLSNDKLPNSKNITRVVLVNEKGERVLDTLIAPQTKNVPVKGGQKLALFKYAEAKAESLETVMRRVR
jgi:hypothetical protein